MNKDKFLVKDGNRAEWGMPEGYPYKEQSELVIEWDGNTDGLDNIKGMFYLVSPEILTDEEIKNSVITFNSNGGIYTVKPIDNWGGRYNDITEEIVHIDETYVAFVRKSGAEFMGATVEKPGIYFMSYSGITTTSFKTETKAIQTIDPDYLPEGYPHKVIEKVDKIVLPVSDDERVYKVFSMEVKDGQTYTVVWDGVEYERVAKTGRYNNHPTPYIGNAALWNLGDDTGEPFCIVYDNGCHVCADFSTEHTISVSTETTHPISSDFLPLATSTAAGAMKQAAAVANVTAAPTAEEFNALLKSLRDAGILATS